MLRIALLLALPLFTAPADAWEAGVEGALCTLTHDGEEAAVRLTYDPSVPLYTITIERLEPWPIAERFTMSFHGAQPNMISTNRHVLSPDRRRLSVSDRGFGNVLDGLQFNDTATGLSGLETVVLDLEGAAPEVAIFRTCGQAPSV